MIVVIHMTIIVCVRLSLMIVKKQVCKNILKIWITNFKSVISYTIYHVGERNHEAFLFRTNYLYLLQIKHRTSKRMSHSGHITVLGKIKLFFLNTNNLTFSYDFNCVSHPSRSSFLPPILGTWFFLVICPIICHMVKKD